MAEPADEEGLRAAQKQVQPFLAGVARLLARRWLREQHQQEDETPQDRPELQAEQPES